MIRIVAPIHGFLNPLDFNRRVLLPLILIRNAIPAFILDAMLGSAIGTFLALLQTRLSTVPLLTTLVQVGKILARTFWQAAFLAIQVLELALWFPVFVLANVGGFIAIAGGIMNLIHFVGAWGFGATWLFTSPLLWWIGWAIFGIPAAINFLQCVFWLSIWLPTASLVWIPNLYLTCLWFTGVVLSAINILGLGAANLFTLIRIVTLTLPLDFASLILSLNVAALALLPIFNWRWSVLVPYFLSLIPGAIARVALGKLLVAMTGLIINNLLMTLPTVFQKTQKSFFRGIFLWEKFFLIE